MPNNFKNSDLGVFEKSFNQILEKHKLSFKSQPILEILISSISGQILPEEMPDALIETIGIEFDQAADLAYDLKVSILDKKKDLEKVKSVLEQETELEFSPQTIANELLANLKNFKIKDEILQKRFSQAILSWLKGVRDLSELKAVLTRGEKIGGCGMPEEVFDQLYDLLVAKQEEIKNANVDMNAIIAQSEGAGARPTEDKDIEIDVASKIKQVEAKEALTGGAVTLNKLLQEKGVDYGELARKEEILKSLQQGPAIVDANQRKGASFVQEIEAEEKFLESKPEIKQPPMVEAMPAPKAPARPIMQPANTQPASAVKVEVKQPLIKQVQPEISRPRMEDVKFTAKLYSLTDELAALKVEDFRRLSKDPAEATLKIKAKLDLLEDESIMKKVEGIKALKSSPLYKVYAGIMNQSIKEGKSFDQVITENPKITLAEFKAIMELNKNLKY